MKESKLKSYDGPERFPFPHQFEIFKDPAGFLEVARRVTKKKPILALKTGKTSEPTVEARQIYGALGYMENPY